MGGGRSQRKFDIVNSRFKMTRFPVLERLFLFLENLFHILEHLFHVLECPFPVSERPFLF